MCVDKNNISFTKKAKMMMSIIVSFFFSFTIILFTPYDMFFGNQSDFAFGFSDFWWIMASFGLAFFSILTIIFILLPMKAFVVSISTVFSLTLCAYIQRMFLNLYVPIVVGEKLNTGDHPIWGIINICLWACIVGGVIFLTRKKKAWENFIIIFSAALILVQSVALISLLLTQELKQEMGLTTDGLYEVSEEKNIITFVLDTYDFSYADAVNREYPEFYNELTGFTWFDDTTGVYSRTFPAVPYLLTGFESDEFSGDSMDYNIEKAFLESSFLDDIKKQQFALEIYSYDWVIAKSKNSDISNYAHVESYPLYFTTIREMLKSSLYFEAPYLLKPLFWFYNEFNSSVQNNRYRIDDAELYAGLKKYGLTTNNNNCYKFIHLFGAHGPNTLNSKGERVKEGVHHMEQFRGCMKIVFDYLSQMKKLDVYKDATIIITADHGRMDAGELAFATGPILFVKPAGAESEPLKISHTPVSHSNIFPTVIQAAGGDFEKYGTPFFAVDENFERTSIFHYSQMDKDAVTQKIVDYEITGDVKDFENWRALNP